jgi:hypothetical protein
MELLAEPQPALAWVCPECGHGSPEPRDQQAHLDAHRQLRQFFREWDAAAAADRRSRRPLVIGTLALVAAIALAVLALLRVSGGGDVPPARSPVPAPAERPASQPPQAAPPVGSPAPPAAAAPASPARPEQGGGSAARPAPAGGTGATAASGAAVAAAGIAPPRASSATATSPAPPVPTIPPAPTATVGLAVHVCLLVVCVDLGS